LTPELDIIRNRHWPVTVEPARSSVTPEQLKVCGRDEGIWPCDAFRLLAEVNRLTGRLPYERLAGHHDEAVRILAAVEGLPPYQFAMHFLAEAVDRAAVIAAIKGETT
jgi:hypothetical protein